MYKEPDRGDSAPGPCVAPGTRRRSARIVHVVVAIGSAALVSLVGGGLAGDEHAAGETPPWLCGQVCAEPEKGDENLQAACYSCRCAQVAGRPVSMDKASETPRARTFRLKATKPPFSEEFLPETDAYPASCINPALLEAVDEEHACATGNRLGQEKWSVEEGGKTLTVWAKWIWRKKGATDPGRYNDWGKIYHRSDGFTCFFDDRNDRSEGRDGDSLGGRSSADSRAKDYPALDLTWVVKKWQARADLTIAERVSEIAKDRDIERWRDSFRLITGESPGDCAECHSAGPFLYTPLLTRLQHKGMDIPWQSVPRDMGAFEAFRYVVPGRDGGALEVGTGEIGGDGQQPEPVRILMDPRPLTEAGVKHFLNRFKQRSKELTGKERVSSVMFDNQEPVTRCMACHFIASAGDDRFYLRGLAVNSTGTLADPVEGHHRPYQAGFKTLLLEPLKRVGVARLADVYAWAMWMPQFGRRPSDLAGWWDRYLESKVMIEMCGEKREEDAVCVFEGLPKTDARLPAFRKDP